MKFTHGFIAISNKEFDTFTQALKIRELQATDVRRETKIRWLIDEENHHDSIESVKTYFTQFYLRDQRINEKFPDDHKLFAPVKK